MFIDTHCHLTGEFAEPIDIANVLARAADANIGTIVAASAHPADPEKLIKIVDSYKNIFCTLGYHPDEAENDALPDYEHLLSHPKVVGIGEIGLDFYRHANKNVASSSRNIDECLSLSNTQKQFNLFHEQLDLALKHKLPVAIHSREANEEMLSILTYSGLDDLRGVMHCYTSGWELAKKILDRGFYFSASGILTFKDSAEVRDTFRQIPINKIIIETDSPFCAPIPYRGKKAEPYMLPMIATVLAELHGVTIDKMENILFENTCALYPKIKI